MHTDAIVTWRRIFQQTRVFIIILLTAFHQQRAVSAIVICVFDPFNFGVTQRVVR